MDSLQGTQFKRQAFWERLDIVNFVNLLMVFVEFYLLNLLSYGDFVQIGISILSGRCRLRRYGLFAGTLLRLDGNTLLWFCPQVYWETPCRVYILVWMCLEALADYPLFVGLCVMLAANRVETQWEVKQAFNFNLFFQLKCGLVVKEGTHFPKLYGHIFKDYVLGCILLSNKAGLLACVVNLIDYGRMVLPLLDNSVIRWNNLSKFCYRA